MQIKTIMKNAINISRKIIKNFKFKKINLKSSKGYVSLLVLGIIAFVGTCWAGLNTEPFIQNTQLQNTQRKR